MRAWGKGASTDKRLIYEHGDGEGKEEGDHGPNHDGRGLDKEDNGKIWKDV